MAAGWRTFWVGVIGLGASVMPAFAQSMDPILNYCARYQHSSVVKGDMMYLDGGIQRYRLDGDTYASENTNASHYQAVNEWIVAVPMNETWNWQTNITEFKYSKTTNPITGLTPVNGTIRTALYQGPSNQNSIFAFAGTSYLDNRTFPGWFEIQSAANPLWSFDPSTGLWTAYSARLQWQPNYGLTAEDTEHSLAFYLNGQIDAGSAKGLDSMRNRTINLQGMIVIDLQNQTIQNISTPGLPEATYPRAGGVMAYVPGLGSEGVLTALGGAYGNFPLAYDNFENQTLADFKTVDVFDIAAYLKNPSSNGSWYSQATSGDIPPPRIDTCVIVKSAPDNSSHNIYMYGGRDPTNSNGTLHYDDVYVLSLPSFIWTNIYVGSSPRYGHTCHAVGNRQMLTAGGLTDKTKSTCDWEYRGVAMYDLSAGIWGPTFIKDDDPYNITQEVVVKIGGTVEGGATITSPVNGWTTPALEQVLFTPRSSSNSSSKGIIIGASVASVVGVFLVLTTIFFCVRRRRATRKVKPKVEPAMEADGNAKAEIEGDAKYPEELPGLVIPLELDGVLKLTEMPVGPAELEAEHGVSETGPRSPTDIAELPGEDAPAPAYRGPGMSPIPEKDEKEKEAYDNEYHV